MRKTSTILFILKLLKFPIAIFSYIIIAKYFGISYEKDVWLLVISTITTIDLAIWGPLNDIFKAKFITIKEEEGEFSALNKTRSLLFFMFLFSFIIVILIEFFPTILVKIITENYINEKYLLLIKMLRFSAPILLINQATLICSSILNSYESFYIPEIAAFISQIFNLILVILLTKFIGIYSLLIGTYLSLIILIILLLNHFKKKNIKIFKKFKPNFNDFLTYFIFALPLFTPYLIGQFNGMLEKKLASGLNVGSLSIIDFSRKFPEIFNTLLFSVVLTVLVPSLTSSYIKKNKVKFNNDFLNSYQLILIGIGFFSTIMINSSLSIMSILYKNSSITQNSIEQIAYLNTIYSLNLFAIFTYIIFGTVLISIGKTKLNAIIGTISQLLIIIINVLLIDQYGINIFPFSILISHTISGLLMAYYYPYGKKKILRISIKYYSYILTCIIIIYYLTEFIKIYNFKIINNDYSKLTLQLTIQTLVFILLGKLFKIDEINLIANYTKTKLKKNK